MVLNVILVEVKQYTLRTVVERHIKSGSTVTLCALRPVYSDTTQLNSTRRLVVQRVDRRVGIGRLVLSVVTHSRAI